MKTFIDDLKEYLKNTPKEEVAAAWEATKEWDNVGPTYDEYREFLNHVVVKTDEGIKPIGKATQELYERLVEEEKSKSRICIIGDPCVGISSALTVDKNEIIVIDSVPHGYIQETQPMEFVIKNTIVPYHDTTLYNLNRDNKRGKGKGRGNPPKYF